MYFIFLTSKTLQKFFNCFISKKALLHSFDYNMDRVKRTWYLSPMQAAKVQASLRIRAVSPEPSLLAHTSSESRGTFRQKARSLAPLNGWACAVKICHDGMLEDTHSLDGAHILSFSIYVEIIVLFLTFMQSLITCISIFSSPEPKAHKVSL